MHYRSYPALLRHLGPAERRGPLALVLLQDGLQVPETLTHYRDAGMSAVIALGPDTAPPGPATHSAPFDVHREGAMTAAVAALFRAAPGAWIVPSWNGERLIWPHHDSRSLPDLFEFLAEERRTAMGGFVLDAYPGNTNGGLQIDTMGYRQSADGAVHGGLRDRIGTGCPAAGRRLDRPLALRAERGLWLNDDGRTGDPDRDSLHAPWHQSPTGALLSLRVWAWLAARPEHVYRRFPCHWTGSTEISSPSTDLRDLGFIGPGQWV